MGLYIFNFITKLSLPLYLGSSFLHCGGVAGCVPCTYNKSQFGKKGLTIHRTLICFNLSMDITSPVCVGPDLLHDKRVFGVWVCMYKKGWVDWKGLTIFNNQISFFLSKGSVNFQLHYRSVPASVPWMDCGRVPVCVPCTYKESWFGQKGLTIDGTVMHFNFSLDVTSPVCVGPDLLHG